MASVIRGSDNFDSGVVGITLGTEVATTSGTSIDFTGLPAGTKRITVMFQGVSTNGSSEKLVQLGDSGGVEVLGYLGSGVTLTSGGNGNNNYTTGVGIRSSSAADIIHGSLVISLDNESNFTWVASGALAKSNSSDILVTAGSKSLSAELDRVRITTVNGTDTFDAGSINISYE